LVFEINSPPKLAEEYPDSISFIRPELLFSDTLSGTITAGEDNSMNPTFACKQLIADLTGLIGLLNRGDCAFNIKAENA